MKLIFFRKPTVYLFYAFLFFIIEYFILRFSLNQTECNKSNNIENADNGQIGKQQLLLNDYYHRIVELRNELDTLKKSQANCLPTGVAATSNNECEGEHVGETFVRDFYRYDCKNSNRYGAGQAKPEDRVDGMYIHNIEWLNEI